VSKLTKLIKHPVLYFKDAKRNKLYASEVSNINTVKPVPKNFRLPSAHTGTKTLILDAINPLDPIKHLIHTGEGKTHGPSHLNQWIPHFMNSGESFAVLVRHLDLYFWVREVYPTVNVVFARRPIDIEEMLKNLPNLIGIYYLSNTGNLIHSLRFNDYKHIFLGHGDSEKAASAHKFFRVYDEVWVSGQAHIDRFSNAGFKTGHMEFVKVGRPTLKNIFEQGRIPWYKRLDTNKILYLPTWEGVYEESDYSSVHIATQMFRKVVEKFKLPITVKFHPVTGSRDKSLLKVPAELDKQILKRGGTINIADQSVPLDEHLVLASNIYICDISAAISECIPANSPIFIYIPKEKQIVTSKSNMGFDDYAYIYSTEDELIEKLEKVLNGNDYLAAQRSAAVDYFITSDATSNNGFHRALRELQAEEQLNEH